VHLVSAVTQDTGAVLWHVAVAQKSNEIPAFPVLLDGIQDLRNTVMTADAMHTQRPRHLPSQSWRPLRVEGQR